ncbi:MAG TPA: DUF2089 domain-containing protein [Planctomycetes bacterium]|nr:DUF2089 domain-containing protein [Planctomycetota bacterium]
MLTWNSLTKLTAGQEIIVERVRIKSNGVKIEGEFEPPPLAQLSSEDQVFVAAFVRAHGSIKEMEQLFGISYPTVKARLNRIGDALGFMKVDVERMPDRPRVLEKLEKGEISVDEAVERLREC